MSASSSIRKAETGWVWPVPGHHLINEHIQSSHQGDGQFASARKHGSHNGIDISGYLGASIVAAADGAVFNLLPNPSRDYGKVLAIRHHGDVFSVYSHLSEILVTPGEAVKAGQRIALMGDTGNTPPNARFHLHFEVRVGSCLPVVSGGRVTSPWTYLTRPPALIIRRSGWRN